MVHECPFCCSNLQLYFKESKEVVFDCGTNLLPTVEEREWYVRTGCHGRSGVVIEWIL